MCSAARRIRGLASLPLILLFCSASSALAQARAVTFDELRRALSPGDVVSVVQGTGAPVRGRLVRIDDAVIEITAAGAGTAGAERQMRLTIPREAIVAAERRRDSTRNGTLIGAGIGGGVALALFAHAVAVDRNEMDEWAAGYALGGGVVTGLGALIGWAIDAAHSKPHVRYDAPPSTKRTMGVAPLRSRHPGIVVIVSF